MKIALNEKQIKTLLNKIIPSQDINEDEETTPTGGVGYPEVGKWESGVTRGAANQVSNSKWSETVGSTLERGKANQLK